MPYQSVKTAIAARRERVHLQQAVSSDDGKGGQTVTRWQTVAEPWAKVTALDERSREALAATQLTVTQAYHVDIPYRDGVTPDLRLIWRTVTLQIHSIVDDDQRRERLVLLCSEVQA